MTPSYKCAPDNNKPTFSEILLLAMEDLLYVEDEYEYYTESEVEADGEEEEDDDDETIKNVPIRSVSKIIFKRAHGHSERHFMVIVPQP